MDKRLPRRDKEYNFKKGEAYDWMQLLDRLTLQPVIALDEEKGTYKCQDPALERLLRIVTNGEIRWLRAFFYKTGRFRMNALRDYDGRIRMFILAYGLEKALAGDLKWAEFCLDLIDRFGKAYEKRKTVTTPAAGRRRAGRPKKTEETPDAIQRALTELQGMGPEGQEPEAEE